LGFRLHDSVIAVRTYEWARLRVKPRQGTPRASRGLRRDLAWTAKLCGRRSGVLFRLASRALRDSDEMVFIDADVSVSKRMCPTP
jgi:hypothetical protein